MNVSAFSKSLERARKRAEKRHLEAAVNAYARLIRRVGNMASTQLRAQSVTAAASWQPPPDGLLFQVATVAPVAARALSSIHERIVAAVSGPPLERIGIAWDVSHPLTADLLAKAAQRTGEQLGEAVQPVLREAVAQAYAEGLSVRDAASLIREKIDEAAPWQAEMLARTDLNGLSNGGSVIAAKLAGIETKTWLTASDGQVRPAHAAASGQSVPIDQPFLVGGESLAYPGDPASSDANVANCRCSVLFGDDAVTAAADEGEAMSEVLTAAVAAPVRWQAVLAVEGEPTEDGRMLAPGSITWRDTPLPLMGLTQTGPGGHEGAEVAGRIDEIWRDGSKIMGAGCFDSGEIGAEVSRLVREQTLRGVSVDLAIREFEVQLLDEEGAPSGEAADTDALLDALAEGVDVLHVVTDGVIGMATVCPFQAIGNASIAITASADETEWTLAREDGAFSFPGPTIDDRLAGALGTLAQVTEMASELGNEKRRNAELSELIEVTRADSEHQTQAHKEETLRLIESLTSRIASGEQVSQAVVSAMTSLTERNSTPRSVSVNRDEQGRAVSYQMAAGRTMKVIRDKAGRAVGYQEE